MADPVFSRVLEFNYLSSKGFKIDPAEHSPAC
jgi:hypothetical protein